jgi:hypothetical protein
MTHLTHTCLNVIVQHMVTGFLILIILINMLKLDMALSSNVYMIKKKCLPDDGLLARNMFHI